MHNLHKPGDECSYCRTKSNIHSAGCPFGNLDISADEIFAKQELFLRAFNEGVVYQDIGSETDLSYLLGFYAGKEYGKILPEFEIQARRFHAWQVSAP